MPFGCFGKRKKKEKALGEGSANDLAGAPVAATGSAPVSADPPTKKDGDITDATDQVVATRAHNLHASAGPPGGHIQKSATLARYDFLRKSDYVNSADRWAALKEQYLAPGKMTQSQHGAHLVLPPAANGPTPRGPGRVAQSLPRQFSPPSTVVSVVKFSQWFYERQVKEEEARREALDREEKNRTDLPDHPDAELEDAATRIQAGFRGYQTRKHLEEARHHADEEHQNSEQHNQQQQQEQQPHDEHLPDDLDESDPRLNAAAVKIQAGFKGMQARKEVRELRKHKDEDEHHVEHQVEDGDHQVNEHHSDEQPGDEDHENEHQVPEHSAEEMNAAATKIQAGFKGFKTRKQMGKLHDPHADQQHHEAAEHGDGTAS